jgi:hypothetical protein
MVKFGCGHLDVLQWCQANGCVCNDGSIYNQVEILEWCIEKMIAHTMPNL